MDFIVHFVYFKVACLYVLPNQQTIVLVIIQTCSFIVFKYCGKAYLFHTLPQLHSLFLILIPKNPSDSRCHVNKVFKQFPFNLDTVPVHQMKSASGFSDIIRRSRFCPILKYSAASSIDSVYCSQNGISFFCICYTSIPRGAYTLPLCSPPSWSMFERTFLWECTSSGMYGNCFLTIAASSSVKRK